MHVTTSQQQQQSLLAPLPCVKFILKLLEIKKKELLYWVLGNVTIGASRARQAVDISIKGK